MSSFDERLQQRGLADSTCEKYREILNSAPSEDLVGWLHRQPEDIPIGTMLPMRAAVKHYLIGALGYDADGVEALLPPATGKAPAHKPSLTADQLSAYHKAVASISDPARTVLTLLPMTGFRISELCALRVGHLSWEEESLNAVFVTESGQSRRVPFARNATRALLDYLERVKPQDALFVTHNYGAAITPHAIRKYTRQIAEKHASLAGLTPQLLRQTYATLALQRGVGLTTVQRAMGHASTQTTARYAVK
jgi:integrase/recombinase XerD